jgi:hypothetical protein
MLFLGSVACSGQTVPSNFLSVQTNHIASKQIEGPDYLVHRLNDRVNKMLADINTVKLNWDDRNNPTATTVKPTLAVTFKLLESASFLCDNDSVPMEWATYGTSRRLTIDNSVKLMPLSEFRAADSERR